MSGLIASDNGGSGNFQILEAGTHAAVCTQVIGIGPQDTPWGKKEKVKIRFEVPAERVTRETENEQCEGPAVIWSTYTLSLTDKANLRHDLESWRGQAFTDDELKGWDLKNILGAPAMISVVHRESNGKTYANITGISKLPKGMTKPEPEGDLVLFNPREHTEEELQALPNWLQERVAEGVANMGQSESPAPEADEGFKDDIPFNQVAA